MSAELTVPVSRTNPHFQIGESPAAHARRRGWGAGTRLIGDEGYGPTTITITAIGKEAVLARADDSDRARSWSLACRDWQALPGLPGDADDWDCFAMDAIEHVAAAHGLTVEQLMHGAQALHQYEETQRGTGGQVALPMTNRHVHTALRVLATLNLPPL